MALTYTLKDAYGHLLVTASGCPDTKEDMFQYIDCVFREVRHRGYPSVLVDESSVTLRFDIMNAVVREIIPSIDFESMQIIHVALVSAPHSVELYKFFEGVFKDEIFHFKAFDDKSCGEKWLQTTSGNRFAGETNYSYEGESKEGYLHINLAGKLDEVNDVLVLSGELIREITARETSCILISSRGAKIDLDVSQAFKVAQTLGDYIPLLGLRIASVPHANHVELDRFFETVFQNRSINYRVFESEEQAKEWLRARNYMPAHAVPTR